MEDPYFYIGHTSSNAGFSFAMLVYRSVLKESRNFFFAFGRTREICWFGYLKSSPHQKQAQEAAGENLIYHGRAGARRY